jgi:tagatose 6-phosphate kinase
VGVAHDFVWAAGETRHALVLIDRAAGDQSTVSAATLRADERHLHALRAVMRRRLPETGAAVLAGSLPEGWPVDAYAPLIAECREMGVPALLDTSGPALRAALLQPPDILKINLAELSSLVALADATIGGVALAAAGLHERMRNHAVIVTLGDQGAVAAAGGRLWHAQPPAVEVMNSAGAGDALAGCVAWSRAAGHDWPDALRLGVAAATAVVTTAGTACCDRATVERLVQQVQIKRFDESC